MTRKSDLEKELLKYLKSLPVEEQAKHLRRLDKELFNLRARHRDLQRKYRMAESELIRAEDLLSVASGLSEEPKKRATARRPQLTMGNATAIVCANDWHADEVVTPDKVNGLNEFNRDIAAERISRLWVKADKFINQARSLSNISELVLWIGGDMISGWIHQDLVARTWAPPADACAFVRDELAEGIKFLKNQVGCDVLHVIANVGNHSRTTVKPAVGSATGTSWETVIYGSLEMLFRDDEAIQFHISSADAFEAFIQGHLVRFRHGDQVNYRGGVGGVTVPLNKAIARWNQQSNQIAAFDVIGHFHNFLEQNNLVISGSLIGYTPYAASKGMPPDPPSQALIIVDRDYGKVSATPLFCGKREERKIQHTFKVK